jgi:opacity protein-like surface antigen
VPTLRSFSCLPALATAAVVLTLASRADAFERQWHAGVDLGLAAISWNDEIRSGLGGGIHVAYGLTDSYNLMLELGTSSHAIYADRPVLRANHGALGMAYTLDVISWVPYVGLLVGGYRFSGAELEEAEHRLGFQGALGLDYRPSRSWAVGVQLRYHTFAQEPLQTHYMTSFARFEWLWGW